MGGLLLAAGCSRLPTAPSPVSAPHPVAAIPQMAVPVPPRLSIDPPKGVGVSRFVAFGDSITWGAYSGWDPRVLVAATLGGYVERLHAGLTTHHAPQQFTMFNEGIPGEFASHPEALNRFRRMLTERRPGAVLLLEGANDLSSDVNISVIVGALRDMVTAATSQGVPVLIATMYQTYEVTVPPEKGGGIRTNGAAHVPEFNRQLRLMVAGRTNVHLVDLAPVMTDRSLVGNDGIHLTDPGFEVMASMFLAAIEVVFPVRGSFQ